MRYDRYPMPSEKQPAKEKAKTDLAVGHFKIYEVEVVHPGYAYTWTDDATGLRLETNLHPKDINRRDPKEGIVFFKTEQAVWGWAKRVAYLTKSAKD